MKTETVNFKTDVITKIKAQKVAHMIGIPLSNLLNDYLHELASIESVYFTTTEPITEKMEKLIVQAEKDIISGSVSIKFKTIEEMFAHLDSL